LAVGTGGRTEKKAEKKKAAKKMAVC